MSLIVQKTRLSRTIILMVLGMMIFLVPETALATTQFPDLLYLNGQKHPLDSFPLEQYYSPGKPRPKFRAPNTATWRGYIATWEIDQGVLYLKAIGGWTDQGEVRLEEPVFPARKARWPLPGLPGNLRSPRGRNNQNGGAPAYL